MAYHTGQLPSHFPEVGGLGGLLGIVGIRVAWDGAGWGTVCRGWVVEALSPQSSLLLLGPLPQTGVPSQCPCLPS